MNFLSNFGNTYPLNWKVNLYFFLFLFSSLSMNANDTYTYATVDEHRSHQKTLTVEGGNIAYLDMGSGEPILLLHGLPTSSWLYRHMIDDLLKRGYRVIAPDMLGYGASSKPQDYDQYAADKQADRLISLMNHLDIAEWTHVMHDAGGLWTWEMMRKASSRVKRLVILDTIAYEEGFKPPMKFKRKGKFGKFLISLYDRKLIGKMIINSTLKSGTNKHKFSKEDKRGYWLPMQEGCNKAIFQFFSSYDKTKEILNQAHQMFETLDIPVTVIWGKHDKFLLGDKQIPLLQKALKIADEDVHILEDAGHFIQEEEPKKIVDLICGFMERG